MSRLLVVEADPVVAAALSSLLGRSGYQVMSVEDGETAIREVRNGHPDLVVFGVGLPESNRWRVVEQLREVSDAPVLVLSPPGHETTNGVADRGVPDDVITGPYTNGELLARIEALLRRASDAATRLNGPYDDGVIRLDPIGGRVMLHGAEVPLTPTEFRLLNAMVQQAGTVLSANQLLAKVWDDPTGIGQERVRFAVLRLRRKLGWTDPYTSAIQAVDGFGYRYRRPRAAAGSGPLRPPFAAPDASGRSTVVAPAAVAVADSRVAEVPIDGVGVDVYLATDDELVARRVFAAVDVLSQLLGFAEPSAEEIHRGSFFRRVRTAFRQGLTSNEVTSRLIKIERAIELAQVDSRQAKVDVAEAKAVAELFDALTDVSHACVKIGSILLAKYPGAAGPVILCRNLSQAELRALDLYPEIQTEPSRAMQALATATSMLDLNTADLARSKPNRKE